MALDPKADALSQTSAYTIRGDLSEYLTTMDDEVAHEVYPGTERMEYDFAMERTSMNSTTILESITYLIKGCIGAGVLGMHEAFKYGGIWTSLVATYVIGIIVSHCMMTLVRSAQTMYVRMRVPRLSYPDLMEVAVATGPFKHCRALSKFFRYLVDFLILIGMCGSCSVYQIIIAHTFKDAVESTSPAIQEARLTMTWYILIVAIPLLLLCLVTKMKYLAPFSMLTDLVILICIFTTIYYAMQSATDLSERPAWKNLQGLFRFCGVCLFSVEGTAVTLSIENNMKRPKMFHYVLYISMSVVLLFISVVGFFGYWGWGEESKSPITSHLPNSIGSIVLHYLVTIVLSLAFTVHFWVPFKIIWRYVGKKYIGRRRRYYEMLHRAVHIGCITCVAIVVPNLMVFMSFLGDFVVACTCFIFPPFIECLVSYRDPKRHRLLYFKNVLIIMIGVTLCGGAFYASFTNLPPYK